MEARHNERMRIAGDLHDTFLQGLLGASFQISIVQDQLDKDAKARPLLDHVSGLMRQLVDEGRNAVRGLRSASFDIDDLEQAIAKIPDDLRLKSSAKFKVAIEGDSCSLRPFARNEIYLIAREAISNGLRHAGASDLDVVLEYLTDGFRLTIRDNGCGFAATTASEKQRDHFGLSIMNERARRLGGTLKVSSAVGAGTEIILFAPGRNVFQPRGPRMSSRVSNG
jgi:signal transduction histidine kinase